MGTDKNIKLHIVTDIKGSKMIRLVREEDAAQICSIYNHYILNTTATAEEHPLDLEEILSRINSISKDFPWYVYEQDNTILGYAYAQKFSPRSAYNHTVEETVYIDKSHQQKGVGTELLKVLLDKLRELQYVIVIAKVTSETEVSIRFHEKFGFEKVGHLKNVLRKFGRIFDILIYQPT